MSKIIKKLQDNLNYAFETSNISQNIDEVCELVQKHEGFSSKPYKCTAGKLTLGYGFNLESRGITKQEADFILANRILEIDQKLAQQWRIYCTLTPKRKMVLIDMAYNLGIGGLFNFKRMFKALNAGDYEEATKEMLNSNWANQVGNRAKELAEIMRNG